MSHKIEDWQYIIQERLQLNTLLTPGAYDHPSEACILKITF